MNTSCTEEDLDFDSDVQLMQPAIRLWMTESFAVISAALCSDCEPGEEEGLVLHRGAILASSYGVDETVRRIQVAVRNQNLRVLACVGTRQRVIVLATAHGGTPILMDTVHCRFSMPLSMLVRTDVKGTTEVLLGMSLWEAAQIGSELPAHVTQNISALPALVEEALEA